MPAGWTWAPDPGTVLAIALDGDRVWAGGKQGLFELERRTGAVRRRVRLPADPIHIRSLTIAPDGALWIGHIDGLIRLRGQEAREWTSADGLPADRVNAVRVVAGRVLVGTANGLAERDGQGRWKRSALTDRLASPVANAMLEASDGALWVGSSSDPHGGLTRIAGDTTQVWRVKDGLPHPYVQDLAEIAPGVVYAATGHWDRGGAVRFEVFQGSARLAQVVGKAEGLAGAKARSVAAGVNGDLWVGSESDGLAIGRRGAFRVLTTRDGLPHNEITTIVPDPAGAMWLGTLDGVVRVPAIDADGDRQ